MTTEYKDFTEDTLELVNSIVSLRFGDGAKNAMRMLLQNPILNEIKSTGCVALDDGEPVCFKAAIPRRMYLGQSQFLCANGAYFCKADKKCPLSVVFEVQERTNWNQCNCRLSFTNTCIYGTMKINTFLGARLGPQSWAEMRYAIIHPLTFLFLLLRRKLFHLPQLHSYKIKPLTNNTKTYFKKGNICIQRLQKIDERLSRFWGRYLSSNKGLVSSRDAETLEWMFGKDMNSGKCVMLAAFNQEDIEGYVIIRVMPGSERRWQILDMIALENSAERIAILLDGAKSFLRKDTDAITLESTGFPDFIQPVLKKHLPHFNKRSHNYCNWNTDDGEIIHAIETEGNTENSWFFGPFDGDYSF